jgi:ketosteroid isomerase-like protein/GNAT superfamily N-acetyltransferase
MPEEPTIPDLENRAVGRAATSRDIPAVTVCLASAFFDDPVWGRWTFPDEATRYERVYELMRFWTAAAVRYPWVRMTNNAEAAALWIPPGESEMTEAEEARLTAWMGEMLGERAGELNDLFDQFDQHHPQEPPHYYLSLWGTHRDYAGRGVGTALIHDNLARLDAEGTPAYLESTNPANLARYEALGFARVEEFGPVGGPVITTMWREARPAAGRLTEEQGQAVSQQNVEIVRSAYLRVLAGEPAPLPGFFHPDAEYHQLPVDPDAAVHRGIDEIARHFRDWNEAYRDLRSEPIEIKGNGDCVFVWVRLIGHGASSGVLADMEYAGVWTLRQGQVIRVVEYVDRADALKAVGLEE